MFTRGERLARIAQNSFAIDERRGGSYARVHSYLLVAQGSSWS
jgi:hypothetical protein